MFTSQTPPPTSSPTSSPFHSTPSPSHKASSPTIRFISLSTSRSFIVFVYFSITTFFISSFSNYSFGWINGFGAIALALARVILFHFLAKYFLSITTKSFASIILSKISLF